MNDLTNLTDMQSYICQCGSKVTQIIGGCIHCADVESRRLETDGWEGQLPARPRKYEQVTPEVDVAGAEWPQIECRLRAERIADSKCPPPASWREATEICDRFSMLEYD